MPLESHYSQARLGEKSQWNTIIASQAMAADVRSDIENGPFALGLMIEIIISSAAALSFTPKLETVDDSGNAIVIWSAAAAIIADGTTTFVFFPGGAVDLDGITEDADTPLPRQWRLFLDHTAGTATVEAHACYL